MAETLLTSDAVTLRAVAVLGPPAPCAEIAAQLRGHRIEVAVMNDVGDLEQDCDLHATPIVLVNDGAARMPLTDLARVHALFPSALAVLVCDSVEGWALRAAIAAGATGLVLAREIPVALFPCLLAVSAGQVCIPRRHRGHLEPRVLSVREKQILGLVVLGHMNGEIAERLFLAESTVKSHLSSAFAKLGVRSRHEAVEVILDPERGLSTGILSLGAEPLELSLGAES